MNGTRVVTVASNAATITIVPIVHAQVPIITEHPQSATYNQNEAAIPKFATYHITDGGTVTYQWYSNTINSNSGGTAIPGATSRSYTPPTTTVGTMYYYVVKTNTNNSVNGTRVVTVASNTASVTVVPLVPSHTITFIVMGGNGLLTATVDGVPVSSGTAVEEAKNIVFTATPNTDFRVREWTLNGMPVSDNTTETYTLYNLSAPAIVTVSFEQPTGIGSAEVGSLQAWTHNGMLYISGLIPDEMFSIYSVSGIRVYHSLAHYSEASVPLNVRGVYIVRQGGDTVKVVVY